MIRIRAAALVAGVLALVFPPFADARTWCEEIDFLAQQALTEFKQIRGKPVPKFPTMFEKPSYSLPFANTCRADVRKGSQSFHCSWYYKDETSTDDHYSKMVAETKACLKRSENKPYKGGNAIGEIFNYRFDDIPLEVMLAKTHTDGTPRGYLTTFSISRDIDMEVHQKKMRQMDEETAKLQDTTIALAARAFSDPDAYQRLRDRALKGDTEAQMRMGLYHYLDFKTADRVERSKEAAKWYQMAAEQGVPMAQYQLANTLTDWEWRERRAEGQTWYEKAFPALLKTAQKGDAEAAVAVATMYRFGNGTAKNEPEAVKWFRTAADRGSTGAMSILATAYEKGEMGLPVDAVAAAEWKKKSETRRSR